MLRHVFYHFKSKSLSQSLLTEELVLFLVRTFVLGASTLPVAFLFSVACLSLPWFDSSFCQFFLQSFPAKGYMGHDPFTSCIFENVFSWSFVRTPIFLSGSLQDIFISSVLKFPKVQLWCKSVFLCMPGTFHSGNSCP